MAGASAEEIVVPRGLDGVVVAATEVGGVRGQEGFFHYREHPAPTLARERSFEEVFHLLHRDHLPDAGELASFAAEVGSMRRLPDGLDPVFDALATRAPRIDLPTVRAGLSAVTAAWGLEPWLEQDPAAVAADALRISAVMPTVVATLWARHHGRPAPEPDPASGLAADFLRMVTDAQPSDQHVTAMERYLILTIDHGFNCSTFATRVVASAGADLGSAIAGGLSALSGPLHGGAPGLVVDMLTEIGSPEAAPAWVEAKLAERQPIMGFGHRVYRASDPRSDLLRETAQAIGGEMAELALAVEPVIEASLDEHRPGRELRTNLEYYAGVVLHLVGLHPTLYPSCFAVSRVVGWTAHALEQMVGNRIMRPLSHYVGPEPELPVDAFVS